MKFLSICSGIEAASIATQDLGWKAAAFSEIEPFPSAVLAHHWPDVPNLGDMTKYNEWPDTLRFDLLCGGTPCQAFSVAGLRKGMDDPRGQLSLNFVEIAAKYRPRWLVWENVPGVFSSDGGTDFASLLAALTGRDIQVPGDGWKNAGYIDGIPEAYGIAWRVFDAQFAGVPQRRRRIFLVGHLGDWRPAAAVLFERHSLQGNPPPSREKREGAAKSIGGRTHWSGGPHPSLNQSNNIGGIGMSNQELFSQEGAGLVPDSICMASGQAGAEIGIGIGTALTCLHEAPIITQQKPAWQTCDCCDDFWCNIHEMHTGECSCPEIDEWESDPYTESFFNKPTHTLRGEGFDASEDGTGRGTPLIPTFCIAENIIGRQDHNGGNGKGYQEDIAYTLNTIAAPAVAFSCKDHGADAGELSPTLRSMGHDGSHANGGGQVAVVTPINTQMGLRGAETSNSKREGLGLGNPGDPAFTLQAAHHHAIATKTAVRRLTPTECERLQGFLDGHTAIPWRGKPADQCPDGPRYKAIGNSWAVPCFRWIAQRINLINSLQN